MNWKLSLLLSLDIAVNVMVFSIGYFFGKVAAIKESIENADKICREAVEHGIAERLREK